MSKANTALIPLLAIRVHPDLQIRGGTNYATVKRYANAMRNGASFPAINLAEVGSNLYVIDGHHRYEAAAAANLGAILATKRRMSLRDAIREAFKSNQAHGRRLTNAEKQHAFAHYIDQKMHLDERQIVKSLRQIAVECPVYDFRTIGKKLKARGIDVPRDGVKSYRFEATAGRSELSEDDLALDQLSALAAFQEGLEKALASYALLDPERQITALERLTSVARALEDPLAI